MEVFPLNTYLLPQSNLCNVCNLLLVGYENNFLMLLKLEFAGGGEWYKIQSSSSCCFKTLTFKKELDLWETAAEK